MIIWIASYPKSGNTYIRSFLSAYFYSKNGEFDFSLLKFIQQFPDKQFFDGFVNNAEQASKMWLPIQREIVKSKKVKFFKTHSAYGSFKNNPFTSNEVTLGGIYVVRDPRNLVTSLMNHFSLDKNNALKMLFDENCEVKSIDGNFATYTFLSSWSNHLKSWNNIKNFRTIIIKYEDLKDNTEKVFVDIIKFINSLLKNEDNVNYSKLNNAIKTTEFDVLKKKEINEGFSEAIISKNKKKLFFNLGFNSDWRKNLDEETIKIIEEKFSSEMKNLGYLI